MTDASVNVPVILDIPGLAQRIAIATAVILTETMTADATMPHCYQALIQQADEHRIQIAELLDCALPPGTGTRITDRARQLAETVEEVNNDGRDAEPQPWPVDGDPADEPGDSLAGYGWGGNQPDRRSVESRPARRARPGGGVGDVRRPARRGAVADRSARQPGNVSKQGGH
jgi:hypothetical protein